MKRVGLLVLGIIFLSGCVSVSKYTPPASTDEKPVFESKMKKQPLVKVDVEVVEKPDFSKFSSPKTYDKVSGGNRGNFEGGVLMLRKNFQQPVQEQPKVWWPQASEERNESASFEESESAKTKMTKYKVKKGQTLADISKDVYGTTKHWKRIYNANKSKIKDPNKIYAGQVLNIPAGESEDAQPVKHKQTKHLK